MYNHQSSNLEDLKRSSDIASDGGDLYLLFGKYRDSVSPSYTSGGDMTTAKQKVVSAPVSADDSPYVTDKDCKLEEEAEDPESPGNFYSKRRMSLNKAERRAEHNAIERARRECLNSKFQQLAEALPNLQNHRRPSKGQIVEKALDWVKQNMSKEDRYQYQIMQLQNENKRLMTQINITHQQRQDSGVITPPDASTSPVTAPFPMNLRPQQYHANSTPTSTEITNNGEKIRVPPGYIHPIEEMGMMYPMVPLGAEWSQQPVFINQINPAEYSMLSASSSSSSIFMNQEDDNESNSSNEDSQRQRHIQMAYSDMSCFDIHRNPHQYPSVAPWIKMHQQQQQYPTVQSTHPSTNITTNPIYNHHHNTAYS